MFADDVTMLICGWVLKQITAFCCKQQSTNPCWARCWGAFSHPVLPAECSALKLRLQHWWWECSDLNDLVQETLPAASVLECPMAEMLHPWATALIACRETKQGFPKGITLLHDFVEYGEAQCGTSRLGRDVQHRTSLIQSSTERANHWVLR